MAALKDLIVLLKLKSLKSSLVYFHIKNVNEANELTEGLQFTPLYANYVNLKHYDKTELSNTKERNDSTRAIRMACRKLLKNFMLFLRSDRTSKAKLPLDPIRKQNTKIINLRVGNSYN